MVRDIFHKDVCQLVMCDIFHGGNVKNQTIDKAAPSANKNVSLSYKILPASAKATLRLLHATSLDFHSKILRLQYCHKLSPLFGEKRMIKGVHVVLLFRFKSALMCDEICTGSRGIQLRSITASLFARNEFDYRNINLFVMMLLPRVEVIWKREASSLPQKRRVPVMPNLAVQAILENRCSDATYNGFPLPTSFASPRLGVETSRTLYLQNNRSKILSALFSLPVP